MFLRDLFVHYRDLSGADRDAADVLLARPTDGGSDVAGDGYQEGVEVREECSTNFCFHWVETTADAVSTTDSNSNGIPDYVQSAADIFENVRGVEVNDLGFRPPKPDTTSADNGGGAQSDVYFADVGGDGIYGYCTSDDPNRTHLGGSYPFYDVSAYCVVDNDFSQAQFGNEVFGLTAMEVTAAHEYFHAIQFAYDVSEDDWLMEGSAVWMEDLVYNDINDYYQYLPVSQMGLPFVPLDYSSPSSDDSLTGQSKYGAFLFFRYLEDHELATTTDGTNYIADIQFMHEIWVNADSTGGASNDQYSLQAVKSMLDARQRKFTTAYQTFGVANLFPFAFYGEGVQYQEIANPDPTLARITGAKPSKVLSGRLDHLTHAYADFFPGKGVRSSSKLKLRIDAPAGRSKGSAVTLVTVLSTGEASFQFINLNSNGDAAFKIPFGKGKIADIVVILTNGSTRLDCGNGRPFSCHGTPKDDQQQFTVKGTLAG
jgi:hypothetical protein